MLLETFSVGPLGCNCTILGDEATGTALVIDPGDELDQIKSRLAHHKLSVQAILHTHTHIDHVGASGGLQQVTGARACIHEADRVLYDMLGVQAAMLGLPAPSKAELEGSLHDGANVRVGPFELSVLHTPGHSPGSVCFILQGSDGPIVFSGDTLFRRGVGRTDLWGGDFDTITRSIQRLYTLDEAARVIPGHGPETTVGQERRLNPFVRAR